MIGNEMFLLKRGCGALGLDEIAKDILDKKDNAMAMEFTKCIGELLRKNGIKPKITEYTRNFETDKTFETRYGVSIDELDFSEHDKAFEDKIANLENQIDRLNEEKSFLRTRCMPYVEKDFDKRLYGKLAIVSCDEEFVDIQKYADGDDLYSIEVRNLISEGGVKRLIGQYRNLSSRLDKMSAENKKLKQRIADLESKLEMYESECDPRNHSKELHYFAIAQNQFFRKENERLKNKNKILYDYIHGITGNTEDEIDKNIKSLERNKNHVDIKATATPMDISTHLINNTCTINELEQIAEHLLVYCKHNKTSE